MRRLAQPPSHFRLRRDHLQGLVTLCFCFLYVLMQTFAIPGMVLEYADCGSDLWKFELSTSVKGTDVSRSVPVTEH